MGNDTTCRSCKQPIRWAVTEKGHRMPVDPAPRADGNVTLTAQGPDEPPLARVGQGGNGPRYVSHFATCPDAPRHRRQR
jgi:hypothetical protein